ncbi:multiple sugar transport system substrate-binding protein [Kineosphaera limosa]|uniref:extracellular solute-binding protein n=1 Tax=Kineosphaera limosa TaxID=111564 RepID=UPI0002DF3466|nr:extracellular solute-binding protein [Kineosphaera limosa]NYE00761.1 multiple sugar transport system substrate-binding protein [Kineosphaera limosa]
MHVQTSLLELGQMRAALGDENVELGAPLKGTVQATFGNPGLLAMTSITAKENQPAALKVMQFLASADQQAKLNKASGTFPTRTDAPPPGDSKDIATMAQALKVAKPGEPSPAARQVMAALAPRIQGALRGDYTPKEALDQAATEANAILARTVR